MNYSEDFELESRKCEFIISNIDVVDDNIKLVSNIEELIVID